jgi:hypothetical protein
MKGLQDPPITEEELKAAVIWGPVTKLRDEMTSV